MAKRTIKVGIWRYKDSDGKYRLGYFGEEVDLSADEIKRAEKAGVFEPVAPAAVFANEIEAQLAAIDPRVSLPTGHAESDAAPLHHDILSTPADVPADVRLDGEDLPDDAVAVAPTLITEPVSSDPAETIVVTPTAPERPKTAQSTAVWREYISKVRPDLTAEQIDGMDKDELKAAAPKDD